MDVSKIPIKKIQELHKKLEKISNQYLWDKYISEFQKKYKLTKLQADNIAYHDLPV